ncbi:MAG TPA: histidinol dehydrogenase [Burkholderiales bacterium]|nr:histidinol dehydrogenase [Burkholderiales bacterium]
MKHYVKQAPPRPAQDRTRVEETVRRMLADIAANRDEAVLRYARDLDRWQGGPLRASDDDIRRVERELPAGFKADFAYSLRQVVGFAKKQLASLSEFETEIEPGVRLGQKLIPVERVGCYVPGGKYPLVASAIMSVGTAKAAGVEHVVACAPPRDASGMYPYTLYALHAAGADEIYHLGGVQALAAMAYGCAGIRPVDMITGAGNAFVAEAKRQLFGTVGIDLLAGPTEILIVADASADPALVATDLLGQAEHGPDSPAWLVTTSRKLGEAVLAEVDGQLKTLPTAAVAGAAWRDYGEIVVVDSDDEAIAAADEYAPEHLEVMTANDDVYLARLRNYGSLFVGEESTVAYGDKGVGTNHTLPTSRAARYTGGLWAGKFVKTVTYQRLTREASRKVAPIMGRICEVEGMLAHKITTDVRVERYTG